MTATPKPLPTRNIDRIADDLVMYVGMTQPGILLELREWFNHDDLAWCKAMGDNDPRDPLALAHRIAAESVWEAFARKLGLPELPDGGYRVEENRLTPEEVAFLKD